MQAGGNWQKLIEEAYCRDGALRFVQALEVDASCPTVEERVKKFVEYTSLCRATYFNLKRHLKEMDQLQSFERINVSTRQLSGQAPIEPNVENEVARAQEDDNSDGTTGTDEIAEDGQAVAAKAFVAKTASEAIMTGQVGHHVADCAKQEQSDRSAEVTRENSCRIY